jgi:lipoprotein NlpI
MRADPDHVRIWNRFVDALYQLHLQQLRETEVYTQSRGGGYGSGATGREFYREVSYYTASSGRLLSRIQWENHEPHSIHTIQVYLYDTEGRVSVDYHAGYLPEFRNAPIRTLVNLHRYRDELRAFRQFDASGRRLYEQCRGRLNGEPVWLEQEFFPPPEEVRESGLYARCFDALDETAGPHLDPLHAVDRAHLWPAHVPESAEALDRLIEQYDRQIPTTPLRSDLRVKRGDAYFLRGEFERAIDDYDAALEIDDALDEAYFGRGMARARHGLIREGIEDLNVFLERNPGSSLGYTKRGIRHLWLGDAQSAEADFREALRIDPRNAEAHSDLGVLLAQRGEYGEAIEHMEAAVRHEPTYQKALHNLGLVHYLLGRMDRALHSVERALELDPRARDSLVLKARILEDLGDLQAAERLREAARDLPRRDWSERVPLD